MRVDLNIHLAPGKRQIRMVPFLLRNRTYAVHELEARLEIGKQKTFRDVVLFHDLPVRQLLCVGQQGLPCKGWHAPAAGDAMFRGQIVH